MNRRQLLTVLAAALAYRPRFAMAERPLPNILVILSDDFGWPYYGFMGHPIVKTPNLDALAAGGVAFANGSVVAPACEPSHLALLSGLNRRDFLGVRDGFGTPTWPQLQQQLPPLGYRTFGTGKWWGGSLERTFTDRRSRYVNVGRAPLTPLFRFLDQATTGSDPWYVFFAPRMPHTPLSPPPEYLALYEGVDVTGEETANNSFGANGTRHYFGMISWLDARIGELIAFIKTKGALDNTLIFYLTDNGAGLKKGKAHFSEAGMRTPIVVNFPGRIPPTGVSPALVGEIDLYPTIMDYVGGPMLPWPDAQSLRGLAEGTTTESRKVYFNNINPWGDLSVRDARYKLYVDTSFAPLHVRDLEADPFEKVELRNTRTGHEVIARLRPVIMAWAARDWALLDQLVAAL